MSEAFSAFSSLPRTFREFKPLYRRQTFIQWIFTATLLNYSDLHFGEVPGLSMPWKEKRFTFALSQANIDQPLNHFYQDNVFNSQPGISPPALRAAASRASLETPPPAFLCTAGWCLTILFWFITELRFSKLPVKSGSVQAWKGFLAKIYSVPATWGWDCVLIFFSEHFMTL